MHEHAPRTDGAALAWQLAMQPALWRQTSLVSMAGAELITQGLDYEAALSQAVRMIPDLNCEHLRVCLAGIEAGRLKGERALRKVRDKE